MFTRIFGLVFLLFVIKNNSAYAQKDSTVKESLGGTIEDAEFLRENLARKRRAKKAARREKFLSTLPKKHNAKAATLLALVPGLGQIYNRRFWKLPIVYGGLGALGYFTVSNYIDYGCFKRAYLHAVDDNPNTTYVCPSTPTATANELKIYRDNAQETAELFVLGLTVFYGLTIIDAFVDAHLMRFDIDDDLSMKIEPKVDYDFSTQRFVPSVGLAIVPRMKKNKPITPYF
ncbi:DUF5683 domain-containing protein [Aureispira anguillae]|uniref:DUF5683 domain-containing protein n=1 Tax=Aureispira anguillae TaxID=2864201 RepID=UPI0022321D61|nr:DUF5683 domain-containing protein [Aureispira anguillae]